MENNGYFKAAFYARTPLYTEMCLYIERRPGHLLWIPLDQAILEALVSLEGLELQCDPAETQTFAFSTTALLNFIGLINIQRK